MRKLTIGAALSALVLGVCGNAAAHPGPKLLTTGSGERIAMTEGMTYEDVSGVHLFRGSVAEKTEKKKHAASKAIKIKIHVTAAHRHIRRLRTQGFYSGNQPLTRRYTQGFYSGR